MTEECKYKFRDKDKFNGKEYCTLFNELCEEVSFVCDKNCQVYEDFKQLKRLEQENAQLKNERTADLAKQLKRLQAENEKIKKQYNCYACGNCRGTEDYINLEKHHKGLRKQFDELVKRNNTLSLRIEELEAGLCKQCDFQKQYFSETKKLLAENEELKAKYEEVANENLKEIYELIKKNDVWRGIVNVMNERPEKQVKTYKQALKEIREIAENYFEECGVPDDYFKRNNYSWKQHQIKGLTCKLQQILDKINEVLK